MSEAVSVRHLRIEKWWNLVSSPHSTTAVREAARVWYLFRSFQNKAEAHLAFVCCWLNDIDDNGLLIVRMTALWLIASSSSHSEREKVTSALVSGRSRWSWISCYMISELCRHWDGCRTDTFQWVYETGALISINIHSHDDGSQTSHFPPVCLTGLDTINIQYVHIYIYWNLIGKPLDNCIGSPYKENVSMSYT